MPRSLGHLAPFAPFALALVCLATSTAACATPKCAPHTPDTSPAASMDAGTPTVVAAAAAAPGDVTEEMTKASAALDRFHAAAAAADEAAYFGLFADGGVFLGTDGKERWTVPQFRAYAHPRFAAGKAWSFRSARRDLQVRGDTAWFDEDLETPNLGPARGSGVLVRDVGGAWKVAQYNLSVPIPNERFADVKKLIEGSSSSRPARGTP